MKEFIKKILKKSFPKKKEEDIDIFFQDSSLLKYLDLKMGAIYGSDKSRRSLANIYAIYSILHFYQKDFYSKPDYYRNFSGYEYTKLFKFFRSLYGGEKLQNHALNSRVNGEFKNKIVNETANDLIIVNESKYALHIDYLYVQSIDISKIAVKIVEEYITLLKQKDHKLITDINLLINMNSIRDKKIKITELLEEKVEARIFEIISYAILKNHYKAIKVYIGFSLDKMREEYLTLYKTGRTNANDGGIDFVMKPLGRFFQVTEVSNYDKYLLDIDKILHFPITFVVKSFQNKELLMDDLREYIEQKSGGMKIIKDRYYSAIEEIITINELKEWLNELTDGSVTELLHDIELYYRLEFNLFDEQF